MSASLLAAALASPVVIAPAMPATVDAAGQRPFRTATLATFAGQWVGHTRILRIRRSGFAKESVGDGCCDSQIDVHFKLSRPRGSTTRATALARVTFVAVHDPSVPADQTPHVGQTRRIRLRHGVITETLTKIIYCDAAAQRRGTCGA